MGMQVTVTRSIEPGMRYCISPSEGMQGIEEGKVVIEDVVHYDSLVQEDPNVESLVEMDPSLTQDMWVLYRYVYCPDMPDMVTDEYVLPMPVDLFADHISTP